jgi:hypothetical protein
MASTAVSDLPMSLMSVSLSDPCPGVRLAGLLDSIVP